ncbi:MAG: energy transducer TonB [Pseudomonas sp.]|nr:energy transducer TonB [Pseudomonas sp.]
MRFFTLLLILFFTLPVAAVEVILVPIYTPKPKYPKALVRTKYPGKTRVSLTIESGGKVHGVRVIEGGHPELTNAVQDAVIHWRYKPWKGTVNAPSTVIVTLPIIFGPRGTKAFAGEINIGLGNVRCAYLNHEVAASRSDYPKEPLSKVDLFWYTREFLSSSYMAQRLPDAGKRKTLLKELQAAIPDVIKNCRRNPESLFGDYLPKSVREVLVGVARVEVVE